MSGQQSPPPPPPPNPALAKLSLRISIAFSVFSVVTFLVAPTIDRVYSIVSATLFVLGILALGLGFWNGIQRSRVDDVRLAGLLSVDKSFVPAGIRNRLWAAVLIETVVTFTFAALRPITEQAFGVLVPTLGIGLATLWGSRFAKFHPRDRQR